MRHLRRVFTFVSLLSLGATGCGSGGGSPPVPPPNGVDASVDVRSPDTAAATDGGTSGDGSSAGDGGPSGECSPATALVCNPLRALPTSLRETGLFPDLANLDRVSANAHVFVPALELWSDGLHKRRQVLLPRGQKIDISNRAAWVFPIGTMVVKTFLGDGPAGPKPVETRIIRRTDNPDPFEQYTFDVYRWNEAGTDATLIDIQERTPVPVTVAGKGHTHQIPSRDDCKKCHTANGANIIGFDEVRLNAPASAGGANQLEAFAQAGFFNRAPPSPALQISDPDPLLQRVKRYVHGNCFHCHNGNDTQAFEMRPESFVMDVVRQPTMGSGTAPGIRVVPGNPEMSVLYRQLTRMNLTQGYNPMPPVGVQVADPEAVMFVRQWIMSLR